MSKVDVKQLNLPTTAGASVLERHLVLAQAISDFLWNLNRTVESISVDKNDLRGAIWYGTSLIGFPQALLWNAWNHGGNVSIGSSLKV